MANSYQQGEKVVRQWGSFEVLHVGPFHTCKILIIKPQHALSLQMHKFRAEHWVVCEGIATIQLDEAMFEVPRGKHIYIERKQIHCVANNTDHDLKLIEVQVGNNLFEEDITRYTQTRNLIREKNK